MHNWQNTGRQKQVFSASINSAMPDTDIDLCPLAVDKAKIHNIIYNVQNHPIQKKTEHASDLLLRGWRAYSPIQFSKLSSLKQWNHGCGETHRQLQT